MKPSIADAYKLIHESAKTFSRMEHHGIRIDVPYLKRAIEEVSDQISTLETELKDHELGKRWRRRFGDKMKFSSRPQLAEILFDKTSELKDDQKTKTGRRRLDADVLEGMSNPFVKTYLKVERLKKMRTTNLEGILRETIRGVLHPFFNLHLVWTYRSSSDSINFQNLPARDEDLARIVRTAFIPWDDEYCIMEADLKGNEVSIGCCFHKDPRLIYDITTPGADMHRDTAMKCFKLKQDEVSKETRSHVKSMFVFAQFYGSWYIDCCKALWQAVERYDLKTTKDVPLFKHLASHGIHQLGACNPKIKTIKNTFEHLIKSVEDDFWQKRFKVYHQWKIDWWEKYCEKGYFDLLTGFRCSGVFDKKQTCNAPIQGSAFHCLLWVLNALDKWLRLNKMKSWIGGQIHDSLYIMAYKKEVDAIAEKIRSLVSDGLHKAWPWIIVPMMAEIKMSEISWADMKDIT